MTVGNNSQPVGHSGLTRILVADDNRDAAETLAELLTLLGYRVEVAFDGLQALEVANTFHPDVLVLDIGMPVMDGIEVASCVRRAPWARDATLVAHTGWGSEEDVRRSLRAGFDHHLVKPMDVHALIGLITRVDAGPVPASMR